ncbi:hypothetical protein K8R14_03135 [bacterium]|nr:hypothetical protein [bacterium]
MSSKPKKKDYGEFINQNGYLFVFTIICGLGLLSYFVCSRYFEEIFIKRELYVLESSAVKGVWIDNASIRCPNIEGLDVDRCVEYSYLDNFEILSTENILFDSNGRVLFSNDELFVSGIFDRRELLNQEIWPDVYIGDLNIKINHKQWVYEDVVLDMESKDPILSLFKTDDGYILLLSPSVSMVNRTKQFWVYKYVSKTEEISGMSFYKDGTPRVFFESGSVSFDAKGSDIFLLFERDDPALMGNIEVEIYRVGQNLSFEQRILLLNGY